MQSKQIQIDDCYLHYIEYQQCNDPLGTMVFLHGFPENWRTWRKQIEHFSHRYRVIAPDLPGYNSSSKPTQLAFYDIANLIRVMSRFIEFVGEGQQVILCAHDWGGAIAWPMVAFHEPLFSHLIILNAAHPSTFTREMIHNPLQRKKSEYIHQLIAEDAIEQVSKDDFAFLVKMFLDDQGQSVLTEAELFENRQSWSIPGVLPSMLNYYKAMPQLAPKSSTENTSGPVTDLQAMKIPNIRVNVKTLVLWGDNDLAFVPELLDGLNEYVLELVIRHLREGNHWIHHQFSDRVNEEIESFLTPQRKTAS